MQAYLWHKIVQIVLFPTSWYTRDIAENLFQSCGCRGNSSLHNFSSELQIFNMFLFQLQLSNSN